MNVLLAAHEHPITSEDVGHWLNLILLYGGLYLAAGIVVAIIARLLMGPSKNDPDFYTNCVLFWATTRTVPPNLRDLRILRLA